VVLVSQDTRGGISHDTTGGNSLYAAGNICQHTADGIQGRRAIY